MTTDAQRSPVDGATHPGRWPLDAAISADEGVEDVDAVDLAGLDIPVLSGLQAQGDLLVVPGADALCRRFDDIEPVPPEGIAVLRGEHPHTLVADPGTCHYASTGPSSTRIGIVEVTTTAYIVHLEHATLGLGPGTYSLRCQREAAARVQGSTRYRVRRIID